jgi:hypothetical protein
MRHALLDVTLDVCDEKARHDYAYTSTDVKDKDFPHLPDAASDLSRCLDSTAAGIISRADSRVGQAR